MKFLALSDSDFDILETVEKADFVDFFVAFCVTSEVLRPSQEALNFQFSFD